MLTAGEEKDVPMLVHIPPAVRKRARVGAAMAGTSMRAYVIEALQEKMQREGVPDEGRGVRIEEEHSPLVE